MQADGGTIFLDEIGEMPEDMQVSLLRFLQDKMINPLGDNRTYKVDVRIVAATNRDLMKEVCKGKFRQDLYYRLNVVNLKLPPLRKRKDDIPTLAENILKQICMDYDIPTKSFSKKCMQHLSQYNWPGNVRELRNLMERALVVSNGEEICTEDFFGEVIHLKKQPNAYEKTAIINLLDKYDGNISATVKAMGVARTTLYRRMKNLNIEVLTK